MTIPPLSLVATYFFIESKDKLISSNTVGLSLDMTTLVFNDHISPSVCP